jgi:hypothetical protein
MPFVLLPGKAFRGTVFLWNLCGSLVLGMPGMLVNGEFRNEF